MHLPVLEYTTKTGVRRLLLTGKPVVVGRLESCALSFRDPTLSRRHCVIEKNGEEFLVRDLGSQNGTLVNGALVTEAKLRSDDVIHVGHVALRFRLMPVRERDGSKLVGEPIIRATMPTEAEAQVGQSGQSGENATSGETTLPLEPVVAEAGTSAPVNGEPMLVAELDDTPMDDGNVGFWREAIDIVVERYGNEEVPDDEDVTSRNPPPKSPESV